MLQKLHSVANFTSSSMLVPDPEKVAACALKYDIKKAEADKKRINIGEFMKKYSSGFMSKPKIKFVKVVDNKIYWLDRKNQPITKALKKYMALKEIQEIRLGKNSTVFKKGSAKGAKAEFCFSLIGMNYRNKARTLDFETTSKDMLESWVRGILYLQHLNLTAKK